jgi:hypothetical protein
MNNSLIKYSDDDIINLGKVFAQSGYFQDAKDAAKAVVKIMAGRELGLPPIMSMTGIHIIKGKVSLSATVMATVLKRSEGYDYKVLDHTEELCQIEFLRDGQSIGVSKFDKADAKQAGLLSGDNYRKYPRNMMFARAMANGVRWFCPEVLGGPMYTPGELDAGMDDGNDDPVIVESNALQGFLQEDEIITERIKELEGHSVGEIIQTIKDEFGRELTPPEVLDIKNGI